MSSSIVNCLKEYASDWHRRMGDVGPIEAAAARIELLEAALRFYACDEHWKLNGQCDPNSSRFEGPNVARAVLDQDR